MAGTDPPIASVLGAPRLEVFANRIQRRLAQSAVAPLRTLAAVMRVRHGTPRPFGVFRASRVAKGKLLVAGFIESTGGTLIALRVLAPFAAFLASREMAFAHFIGHA